MGRWLTSLIVIALGVVWFYGDTWFADEEPVARALEGGPIVIEASGTAATEPGTGRAPGARPQQAQVAAARGSEGAGLARPDDGPSLEATRPRITQPAGQAMEAGADVKQVLARASQRAAAGDRRGAAQLLQQAMAAASSPFESGRLAVQLAALDPRPAESRRLYSQALAQGAVLGAEYEQVGQQLREANRDPRASLLPMVRSASYEVRPNDSLWKICNKVFPQEFGVAPEVGLVKLLNGMTSDTLQLGQSLVVPLDGLHVEIDRHQHGLVVWLGDTALAAYRVGLGKENRTPSGEFVVEVKQVEPDWYREGRRIPFGDPENILGTRWMGFENHPGVIGYGIHGTARPESVGLDESMGCVRMRNSEVEELFDLVARGTRVSIP